MQGALDSGLRAAQEIDQGVTGESSPVAVAISQSGIVHRVAGVAAGWGGAAV
jgi:hypothetical protein